MKSYKNFTKEMKKRLKTDVKGFTLIEVIVVLVILAILMAIAIPNVLGYINRAKNIQGDAAARSAFMASQTVSADILKTNASVTVTELEKSEHKAEILNLAGITVPDGVNSDGMVNVIAATTVGTAEAEVTAKDYDTVTIYVMNGVVNGLVYAPANAEADQIVCYYANGTIEHKNQFTPIDYSAVITTVAGSVG